MKTNKFMCLIYNFILFSANFMGVDKQGFFDKKHIYIKRSFWDWERRLIKKLLKEKGRMNKEEFNLSEKEVSVGNRVKYYKPKDVKEFIKLLKDRFDLLAHTGLFDWQELDLIEEEIDKLAGDKFKETKK